MRCLGSEKWLEISAEQYSDLEGVLSNSGLYKFENSRGACAKRLWIWLARLAQSRLQLHRFLATEFLRVRSQEGLLPCGAHFLYKSRRLPPSNANS